MHSSDSPEFSQMNQSRKDFDETVIQLEETRRYNGEIQRNGEEELEKASNST